MHKNGQNSLWDTNVIHESEPGINVWFDFVDRAGIKYWKIPLSKS